MPRIPTAKPTGSAHDRALLLLARREHSERELLGKLQLRGFDVAESIAALHLLQEQNYQNDERFAGCLVRQRINDGYGPRWIIAELKTHGINDASAQARIAAEDSDWLVVARGQLRRRYAGKAASTPTERNKRAQFLLRRGFEIDTVRSLTRAADTDGIAELD